MMYPALVVFFASLASPAANAFTSSPTLHRMNRYQSSSCLFSDNNEKLNFRFEKYPPSDRKITFPLNEYDADFLKKNTEADAVTIRQDFKSLKYRPTNSDIEEYLNEFKPLTPGTNDFWDQFEEVVDAQIKRRAQKKSPDVETLKNGVDKSIRLYKWPRLWQDRTLSQLDYWNDRSDRKRNVDDVAQSVRGEFSNFHQQDAITRAIANMKGPEFHDLGQYSDRTLPERDFIDFQVRAAEINTWSLEVVARTNFFLKWYHGVPRPEEVAWKIHEDELIERDGVPTYLIKKIKSMNLLDATNFTAYEEGSPTHPSFPAMHSAGSTCSFWFPALYNIEPEDYKQLLRMDYGVAFARTVAGVHYPHDNLAGLNIGQRIVRKKLPEFLAENYGYDAASVESRLDELAFDWNDYDNERGKFNGTTAKKLKVETETVTAKSFLVKANKKLRNKLRSSQS